MLFCGLFGVIVAGLVVNLGLCPYLTRQCEQVVAATSYFASNGPTCGAFKRRGHPELTQWLGVCAGCHDMAR